jgi:hypothetical protein
MSDFLLFVFGLILVTIGVIFITLLWSSIQYILYKFGGVVMFGGFAAFLTYIIVGVVKSKK